MGRKGKRLLSKLSRKKRAVESLKKARALKASTSAYNEETMDGFKDEVKEETKDFHLEHFSDSEVCESQSIKLKIEPVEYADLDESTISAVMDESTWSAEEEIDDTVLAVDLGPSRPTFYNTSFVSAFPPAKDEKEGGGTPRWTIANYIEDRNEEDSGERKNATKNVDIKHENTPVSVPLQRIRKRISTMPLQPITKRISISTIPLQPITKKITIPTLPLRRITKRISCEDKEAYFAENSKAIPTRFSTCKRFPTVTSSFPPEKPRRCCDKIEASKLSICKTKIFVIDSQPHSVSAKNESENVELSDTSQFAVLSGCMESGEVGFRCTKSSFNGAGTSKCFESTEFPMGDSKPNSNLVDGGGSTDGYSVVTDGSNASYFNGVEGIENATEDTGTDSVAVGVTDGGSVSIKTPEGVMNLISNVGSRCTEKTENLREDAILSNCSLETEDSRTGAKEKDLEERTGNLTSYNTPGNGDKLKSVLNKCQERITCAKSTNLVSEGDSAVGNVPYYFNRGARLESSSLSSPNRKVCHKDGRRGAMGSESSNNAELSVCTFASSGFLELSDVLKSRKEDCRASNSSNTPSSDAQSTAVTCETCRNAPPKTPFPKKRLVDVEHLLTQIWSQRHVADRACSFMDMRFVKEDRSSSSNKLMFKCRMCNILSSLSLLPRTPTELRRSFSLHATVVMDMAESSSHRLVARSSTQTKLSPQFKARLKSKAHSDSEGSAESNSLSAENGTIKAPKETKSSKKGNGRRGSEWEILEGLREGQRYETKPNVFTGYLHKKRKWPLKGWHKRYFVIDKGILVYARGPGDISRGKIHGSVDIGLSVISTKSKSKRIDIDAEEFIYHLKAKRLESFNNWLEQLRQHRLYRQHLLTFGTRDSALAPCSDCDSSFQASTLPATSPDNSPTRDNSLKRGLLGNGSLMGGRLAAWLMDSTPQLDTVQKDLKQINQNLLQLAKIFDQVSSLSVAPDSETTSDGLSPNVKKDRKKFGLRKKKSSKGSSVDLAHSPNDNLTPFDKTSNLTSHLSSSQTCLTSSGMANTASRPQSLPGSENLPALPDMRSISTPDLQVREDFLVLAKDIHTSLKSALYRLQSERDRLKSACDAEGNQLLNPPAPSVVATLRSALNQALIQNSELRNKLNRVHEVSDLTDFSSVGGTVDVTQKQMAGSLSYSSSCLSEFFDAEGDEGEEKDVERDKDMTGDSSSENNSLSSDDGEGSVSSENSEPHMDYAPVSSPDGMGYVTGRRTKLPAPKPSAQGLKALWNILCKNIGKDLSQISMPVALNEPLNLLQRMCEDLEYSELLDKANELEDPYDRMVHMAAFAVSGYSNSYFRASSKPFNPLLGETYECIREDKGFRFIAEQVSHHPPISICHAESRNFTFWQDIRIKTKFWGKSLEFQPSGTINVVLPRVNERYTWNKVTTCVHNLFSGQRWVDLYGELKITSSSGISCKLTFVKASYWSAKRHEVFGGVYAPDGSVIRNLFGKWNEALYCGVAPSAKCVWRPGTMPEDYELYYGFTRFAMELNELSRDVATLLPPTDTRFRPDQRLLEEGDLEGAETMKQMLEQRQRERRRLCEEENLPVHKSRWFDRQDSSNEGDDFWTFNHKYWDCRKTPGFKDLQFDPLW